MSLIKISLILFSFIVSFLLITSTYAQEDKANPLIVYQENNATLNEGNVTIIDYSATVTNENVGVADINAEPLIVAQLISPEENSETIAKRPEIKCKFSQPYMTENLLVLLDGVDVTAIITHDEDGFRVKSPEILYAGQHTLNISGHTQDGKEFNQQFTFATRHSETFEQIYSANEFTANWTNTLKKPADTQNQPYSKAEANLASFSAIKHKGWDFSFSTNARYIDQSLALYPPQEKGVDLINYVIKASYQDELKRFNSEIGDVLVNETVNTYQSLSRRGAKFSYGYKNMNVNSFVVKSQQMYGTKNGFGLEMENNDHISGVSGDVTIFSNKLNIKTLYATGGEKENSYGIWNIDGAKEKEGDIWSLAFTSSLFDQKLGLEGEIDLSDYDPDIVDEFSSEKDKAYRIKATTSLGLYNLEGLYEYLGPEYNIIGSQGVQKDRKGYSIAGNAFLDIHLFNFNFSDYQDNVESNTLYPVMKNLLGALDYNFMKFQTMPMGITYQKSIIDSKNEPEYTPGVRMDSDSVSGRINYMLTSWNFGLQGVYSFQNDLTLTGSDTTTYSLVFSPLYYAEKFTFSPNFMYNRTIMHLEDVWTDTYTFNLDIRGELTKKLSYELSGIFNKIIADDNSIDMDGYNSNARLTYNLGKKTSNFFNPSVALAGQYNKTKDYVYKNDNEEFILIFVLSNGMKFSF
jgi:hypothetical protein